MPEANVELARNAFEAFKRHDVEAMLEIFDPEVEFEPASTAALARQRLSSS
jgi:ketosteroid isomerase-like protein